MAQDDQSGKMGPREAGRKGGKARRSKRGRQSDSDQ